MDARERDESQSRRTSNKRPWDGDISTLHNPAGSRIGAVLPPIDAAPSRKLSVPRGTEYGPISTSWYGTESRESDAERPKTEGLDYTFARQNIDANSNHPPPRLGDFISGQHPRPLESPRVSPAKAEGPPPPQESRDLCYRCRGPREQDRDANLGTTSCEGCKRNPDLVWVTQAAAAGLNQLAETLRSGVSSEQRGIIQRSDMPSLASSDFPPIAQFGLKHTLNWIFGSISHVNKLADDFVKNVSTRTSQDPTPGQDGPASSMKRRHNEDVEGVAKKREESASLGSDPDFKFQKRRVSSIIASVGDELPPVRTQHGYRPALHSSDSNSQGQNLSSMNPPHAPNRQLPSPQGRSFPSPTFLNFPSPSGPSPGINSQGGSLPTTLSVSHSIDNHLPPLAAPRASETALREHAAALQHEVSLQKMALSSLQSEHDKLLAAFSRSQTRASTLEKKHAVSDNEIISLTEDNLRLQAQVMDLERDVEEISRSRNEFRQAAVQEGAQYVEIVNKASQLEEIRVGETRAWNQTKEDMERKIAALSAGSRGDSSGEEAASTEFRDVTRDAEEMDIGTGGLVGDPVGEIKIEHTGLPTSDESTPHISYPPQESVESLKRENRRLRERCTQTEEALRQIRDDSRSMEELVKGIQYRADTATED